MYSCLLLCSPSVPLSTKVKSISLLGRKWGVATTHQCPELFAKSPVLLMVGSSSAMGFNFSVLYFFSEVISGWLTQVHYCIDQLLTTVFSFHKLELLLSPYMHTLQHHI